MASDYPSDWNSRRKTVYKRDNYTCQNCGRGGGSRGNAELHAHHIVPKSKGGTHSTSNLIAVCQQCHNAIHGNTHAPSASGSVPGHSSEGGYFDRVSSIIEKTADFADPTARYGPLVEKLLQGNIDDVSRMSTLERQIQRQAIKQKAELANFDAESAPDHVPEKFVDTLSLIFAARIDLIEHTEKLIEDVQDHRELFTATNASGFECPDCGDIVERADAFCGMCGADLSEVGICPDCESDISAESDFCTHCGTPLTDDDVDGDADGTEDEIEICNHIEEQCRDIRDIANYVTTYNLVMRAHAGVVADSTQTEYVSWEYCPNCGFTHSVFRITEAECVVCGARWQKKGIIFKKWEMIEGTQKGKAHPHSEWESFAREHHDKQRYDDFVTDAGGTVEIEQRVARFSH